LIEKDIISQSVLKGHRQRLDSISLLLTDLIGV